MSRTAGHTPDTPQCLFSYSIDATNRLLLATLSGSVRASDIASALCAVYKDPNWKRGFDTVWDCTGIRELLFDRRDLQRLVGVQSELAAKSGQGREILIVSRPVDRMMAKMYAFMMRGQTRSVTVCESKSVATQALGRSFDSMSPG
jgi:hypothetical protein